jgi:hypothetical protein
MQQPIITTPTTPAAEPKIFPSSSQIASTAFGSPPAHIRVFQDALPSAMLASIARSNVMTMRRWMPLPTEPNLSFHLSSLDDGTRTVPNLRPFDAAIQRLRSLVVPSGARCMGVEWRIERADSDDLHYTKDEELFSLTGRIIHPLFSSVIYLSSEGGPTSIVLENDKRIRIHPHKNRFLVFPGHLLNGTPATKVLRLNWWRSRPLNMQAGSIGELIAQPN